MARPQVVERRLGRTLRRATLCFTLFSLCASASAQLELTTRLTPWSPQGWPEGTQGEVHVVTVENAAAEDAEDLQTIFSFPVSETGEVTYRFPEELPRNARRFYYPVSLNAFQLCPEVSPTLSPPEAEMALLYLYLYADGELWGVLDLSAEGGDLFSLDLRSFLGFVYAREPFRVTGSGYCPIDERQVEIALDLQAGLNLLEISASGSLMGGITTRLTTTETLDLPQTPIGIDVGGGVSGGAP